MIAVCFKFIAYFKNYTKKSLSALIIKSFNKEFNTEIEITSNMTHSNHSPPPPTECTLAKTIQSVGNQDGNIC